MSIFENTVLVEKKQTLANKIGFTVLVVLTVFCLYVSLFISPILFAPAIAFGVFAYLVHSNSKIEYEYTYIEGRLSIARIKAKKKRKELAQIEMEEVLLIAPGSSHELDAYKNNQAVKSACVSGEKDAKIYQVVYKGKGGLNMMAFEPDRNMLEMIQGRNPRKVIIED